MKSSKTWKLPRINGAFIKKNAAAVSEEDLERINDRANEIGAKFHSNLSLRRFVSESILLIGLIKDYASGRYKTIPWWAIAATAFTLLYVFNPLDMMPDMVPVFGYLDDATVVTTCLALISHELHKYSRWKKGRNTDAD